MVRVKSARRGAERRPRVTGARPADLIVLGRRHAAIVLARKFVGTGDIIPSCRRTRPEVAWDELDSATPFKLLMLIDSRVSRLANRHLIQNQWRSSRGSDPSMH